jgi:hypothetical protein
MFKITIVIILLLLIISCSLKRNNPLDPLNSGVQAPNKVTGINISVTEEDNVVIQWDAMNSNYIDGYFIYRSQIYDGLYTIIFEPDEADSLFEDIDVFIPENFYWYKMSAYKMVGDKKLEGYRSEPRSWN